MYIGLRIQTCHPESATNCCDLIRPEVESCAVKVICFHHEWVSGEYREYNSAVVRRSLQRWTIYSELQRVNIRRYVHDMIELPT